MTTADLAGYLALALTPGIGPGRLRTLLAAFDTPDGAFSAPFAFLCTLPGYSRAAATAVRAARREDGERAIARAAAAGATVLAPFDRRYPPTLHVIPDPPAALFCAGDLSLLDRAAVAIVGSRDHSDYGARVCAAVSRCAASAGIVVVSGMARGLDAIAHRAALDAGGPSIGVLGNGLGVIYPAANRALYERMQNGGLLVTEFPPGERPHAGSFPRRNRLISGLTRVTVVIEARAGSGTLITVNAALEQGRDVMAVPGPITSPLSVGTNRLLRDGAVPLLEPQDLLDFYPELESSDRPGESIASAGAGAAGSAPSSASLTGSAVALPLPDDLPHAEREVAALLDGSPMHIDAIAERAARPLPELLAILSTLEIRGIVQQQPGRLFHR